MTETEETRRPRTGRTRGRRRPLMGLFVVAAALGALACSLPGMGGGPGGPDVERPAGGEARADIADRVVEAVSPALDPRYARYLPPFPRDSGGLRLRVVYPDTLQLVADHDSNFVFGSVGNGDARLEINGTRVPVEPNGSFLAWLPVPEADWVPPRTRPDTTEDRPLGQPLFSEDRGPTYPDSLGPVGHYRLVARHPDGTVDTLLHPVRRPPDPPRPPGDAAAWIDSTSVGDAPARWALSEEEVEISVRASPEARVWLESRSQRFPLRSELGSMIHRASIKAWRLAGADAASAGDTLMFDVVAATGGDTVRRRHPLPIRVLDPEALPTGTLVEQPDSVSGESGVVIGRTHPYGTYYWRFPEETRVTLSGRSGDRYRVRLAPNLEAWVAEESVEITPDRTGRPSTRVDRVEVRPRSDRLRVTTRLDAPVPLRVEQTGPRTLALTLYGATGSTSRASYGPSDPLLESVDWTQEPGSVYRLEIGLDRDVWGYRTEYRIGESGAAELVFDIRRPPEIDGGSPLEGRRIAVDPGHPGAGATGPTGYYEGDANLAIARQLVAMLEEEGAEPVLIRDDTLQVGLYERTRRAREEGAELFVSIHNNALPNGVRPFREHGTSTYYFHSHARDLAQHVQGGMLEAMGLRDLGVFYGNLAVAREPWMPSALAEGAFMMIPRHEAALETATFQRRYAEGVLEGLRGFLGERAQ